MNTRHIFVAIDNSAAAGTYNLRLDIPWASIMTVKQVDARNDGTIIGCYLVQANWINEGNGIIAALHDGTSTSPQTKFFIPAPIQGTSTITLLGTDMGVSNIQLEICLLLEFEQAEEKKK